MRTLTIGVDDLDGKDELVLRSTLRLRRERWSWVDVFDQADVWLVDPSRGMRRTPRLGLDRPGVIRVMPEAPADAGETRVLRKPIVALRLMRVLDGLVGAMAPQPGAPSSARDGTPGVIPAADSQTAAPPVVQPAAQPAMQLAQAAAEASPWAGRQLRFTQMPNLARYPVTVELLGWLQAMNSKAVSYDLACAALPLDRALLDDILDAAARGGSLIDETGASLQAFARPRHLGRWPWSRH